MPLKSQTPSNQFFSRIVFCLLLASCAKPPDAMMSKSVPELIVDLKSEDGLVRAQAAMAIGEKGEEAKQAIPALIECIDDSKSHVRYRVMAALVKIGQSAVPPLIQAVQTGNREKRFYAAHALGKMSGSDAQKAYQEYMDKEGKEILKHVK